MLPLFDVSLTGSLGTAMEDDDGGGGIMITDSAFFNLKGDVPGRWNNEDRVEDDDDDDGNLLWACFVGAD